MDRLIEGDLIVAVLSDKYLRSPYCMYELFGIFRRCGDRAHQFLVAEHEDPCPERKAQVEPEKSGQVVAAVELRIVAG